MLPATPMPPPSLPALRAVSRATTRDSRSSNSFPIDHNQSSQYGLISQSGSRPGRPRTAASRFSTRSRQTSRTASSIGGGEKHQVICAVSEGRGVSPSVGIAFVNISTGEAILSQINDTQFYIKTIHKIQVFEPSKILLTKSSCPPSPKSMLFTLIEDDLPGVPVVSLDRRYWTEAAGLDFIQTLALSNDVAAIKFAVEGKFYAICAFSAVCLKALFS
jgi:DNA mismatch repair protein MSH4